MNTFSSLLALALLIAPLSAPAALTGDWYDSLAEARQAAAQQGKDVLILYKGEDFEKGEEAPAPLFRSSDFAEEALPLGFVLAEQPAPVQVNDRGKEYRATAVVFTDAEGRPYYSFSSEWQSGMDWVLEELRIARERRPEVERLRKALESKPSASSAGELLLALPPDTELYYEPYARLHAEAMEHDAAYRDECEARDERMRVVRGAIERFVMLMGSESGLQRIVAGDFGTPEEDLAALPNVRMQFHFMREMLLLISRLREQAANNQPMETTQPLLEAALYRSMALAPRCKMARILRVAGIRQLETQVLSLRLANYREAPQEALETINAYAAEVQDSFYAELYCRLMRARVLAELGQFDAAVAELERVESLDPAFSLVKSGRQLRESILANRARLETLRPLIRRGHAAADEEWDKLLTLTLGMSIILSSPDNDLLYESEERAAATLQKARELEQAAAASAAEQAFREKLRAFIDSLPPREAADDLAELQTLAEQGDADAQKALYMLYASGRVAEQDEVTAVSWLQRAAEQGDAEAQYALALYLRHGTVVEKDEAAALSWLRKAALSGHAPSQFALGVACYNGEGVERDLLQASYWFRKAAEQGMPEAEQALQTLTLMNTFLGD